MEFFIDGCEENANNNYNNYNNNGDSNTNTNGNGNNAGTQLPLHLIQSLDVITNCLTIESMQSISVQEQDYESNYTNNSGNGGNNGQNSQNNGRNQFNLRNKYTRK